MDRELVYDLPTRVFHWIFAGLFATAFLIADNIDDDSLTFSWHMLAGLTAGFAVMLRIGWGCVGTRHARFSDFVLSPAEALEYAGGILGGRARRWAGHNPASSWAAVAMMALVLGLGLTGWLMTSGGDKEAIEDIHELLANAVLVLAALHIAGVILHALRHRENLARSMIDGRKADVPQGEAIASARKATGMLFVALAAGFGLVLWSNFDAGQRELSFLGSTLQLGESEYGEKHEEDHDDD